jgi:hypothetical protein
MRKHALWLALALSTALALPALAQQGDYEDEPAAGEEASALQEYGSSVGNRFLVGLNGLITFPADPPMATVDPLAEFEELPVPVVSKRVFGFFQGTLLGAYRLGMAPFDMLFAPITPMKMLSPEPRYMLFPGVEHDWY